MFTRKCVARSISVCKLASVLRVNVFTWNILAHKFSLFVLINVSLGIYQHVNYHKLYGPIYLVCVMLYLIVFLQVDVYDIFFLSTSRSLTETSDRHAKSALNCDLLSS